MVPNNGNNAGSSTVVMEMDPVENGQFHDEGLPAQKKATPSASGRSLSSRRSYRSQGTPDPNETLPSPTTASEQLETWKNPKVNTYRLAATFWSFTVMGLNDAAYGPLIPYLESYYNLSYTVVSLVFLSPAIGYTISAALNNTIHLRYGQRGVAILSPVCHLLAYIVTSVHPPYPVLVVVFIVAGFGNGLADAAWNAWVGSLAHTNEILGFLHGFYGLGAVICPLIATTMVVKAGLPWYYWYYVMIGVAAVELAVSLHSFWAATGAAFREAHPRASDQKGNRMKEALFTQPSARVTWLCALFLLGYVGAEVALGGWIVTFMRNVRHGEPFASGMTATGFWLGITIGRVTLGFITPKIGEKLAIVIYLPIAIALELLFWLVPQFYVSAVAVSLQGFFLGPMFPAAVVAATKLLPKHLHVSAVGFAAAFGGTGGAIFPFAIGAIAQAKGVQVLQPIILAILAMIWILWCFLPRMGKRSE